jgi:hypothetical protein
MSRKVGRQPVAFTTSLLDLCCCILGGLIMLKILLIAKPEAGGGFGEAVERRVRLVVRMPAVGPSDTPLVSPGLVAWDLRRGASHPPHVGRHLMTVGAVRARVYIDNLTETEPIALHELLVQPDPSLTVQTRVGPLTVEVSRELTAMCLGYAGTGPEFFPHEEGAAGAAHPRHQNSIVEAAFTLGLPEKEGHWKVTVELNVKRDGAKASALADRLWVGLRDAWDALALEEGGLFGADRVGGESAAGAGASPAAPVGVRPQEFWAEATGLPDGSVQRGSLPHLAVLYKGPEGEPPPPASALLLHWLDARTEGGKALPQWWDTARARAALAGLGGGGGTPDRYGYRYPVPNDKEPVDLAGFRVYLTVSFRIVPADEGLVLMIDRAALAPLCTCGQGGDCPINKRLRQEGRP